MEIIATPQTAALADCAARALTQAGLACQGRSLHPSDDQASLVLAFVDPPDPVAYFHIGVRVGLGRRVLLASSCMDELPSELRSLPAVASNSESFTQEVVAAARRALNIAATEQPVLNVGDLLAWIASDQSRIGRLTEVQLVDIAALLFEASGLKTSRDRVGGEPDLLVESLDSRLRGLILCKAAATAEAIGLAEVRQLYDSCIQQQANVAFLVSTTRFTRAAEDWAGRCVPPIRLLSRGWLEQAVSASVKKHAWSAARLMSYSDKVDSDDMTLTVKWANFAHLHPERTVESTRAACIVWDSTAAGGNDDIVAALALALRRTHAKVAVLNACLSADVAQLPQWLRRSSEVLVVPGGHDIGSRSEWRLWHRLAHAWPVHDRPLYVLGHQDVNDRLLLPTCFSGAVFVDPGSDPVASLLDRMDVEIGRGGRGGLATESRGGEHDDHSHESGGAAQSRSDHHPAATSAAREHDTLSWVADILRTADRPLSVREIVERAGPHLPIRSRSPDVIVARELAMHIKRRGAASPFVRTSPGRFTLREMVDPTSSDGR